MRDAHGGHADGNRVGPRRRFGATSVASGTSATRASAGTGATGDATGQWQSAREGGTAGVRRGEIRPDEIRFGKIRFFEPSRRSVARGDFDQNVALNPGVECLGGGVEEAESICGQRAAGERKSAAGADWRDDHGEAGLLAAGDGLAHWAGDAHGEIESGARERYGGRRCRCSA